MRAKLSMRTQISVRPQLIMASKFLQVAGADLEQLITREAIDNPALELVSHLPSQRTILQSARAGRTNTLSSSEEMIENVAQPQSPMDILVRQVFLSIDKPDQHIVLKLLHRLDHHGFLTAPVERLAEELEVSKEVVARGIALLHQLEPPGIGARDIRECFLIQCSHLEAQGTDCRHVRCILTFAWNEFLNQQWDRVAKKIKESRETVEQACQFMRVNLHPYPLALTKASEPSNITFHSADLIILRNPYASPPDYSLQIPGQEDFELRLSASFQKMLESEQTNEAPLSLQDRNWIKLHLGQAAMVISALHQRWATLRRIGEYVIQHQRAFLEHGPFHLAPLTRTVISKELNIHESTVSRAVTDKVVRLPSGRLIPLSDFFDTGVPIRETIRFFIQSSPTRLCDREIAEAMREKGIAISRRTVAKYRLEINLKSSPGAPLPT